MRTASIRRAAIAAMAMCALAAGCAPPPDPPPNQPPGPGPSSVPAAVATAVVISGAPTGPLKARTFPKLTAKTAMSDGTMADCPQLTWHSSNHTSVTAAPDGTLQVQDVPGVATITARCKDLSAQITVEVGRTLNVTVWVREPEPRLAGGMGLMHWVPVESAEACEPMGMSRSNM